MRCKACNRLLTWAEQRRQYGRCLKHGLSEVGAKAASPRCGKCMTKHLRHLADIQALLASGKVTTADKIEKANAQ